MSEGETQGLKILIADDSNSDRLLLRVIIEKQGHIPLLAKDGLEAVDIFQKESPDIILLDALMPNMDGFEAARQIKANSGEDFVPIIFLTSLNEADSLAQCLEAGGDDFLTKPYNSVILQAKINAFRRMRNMHVTLQQQRDQISENNMHMIREQEVAKRTFDKVAHEGSLQSTNIQYSMSPLAIFNGDVLLAAVRPNGNLCVLMGDFTGHGLAAAIGAMPLSQTFYSMISKGFSIKDIVTELNRKLKEMLPLGVFCCATMADMDLQAKTIELWSGGMPDNYIYRAATKEISKLPSRHLALGILSPDQFNNKTSIHMMAENDRFYVWSDGIIEAENDGGEMFGEERLHAVFGRNKNAENLFNEINETVNEFIGEGERSDDLSIAEIKMMDVTLFEQENPVAEKGFEIPPMDWGLSYELRPETLRTTDPLPVIQKTLMDIPGFRSRIGEMFTVMSELYSNALEHGVLGLDSELKRSAKGFTEYYRQRHDGLEALAEGYVRFDINYCGDDTQGVLRLQVQDSGEGFDHENIVSQPRLHDDFSGRGLHLIKTICQDVKYLGKGNQVEVVFNW